jgi:hypothetical protein
LSTYVLSRLLMFSLESSGLIERRRPADPAMCGAAIEVPVHRP